MHVILLLGGGALLVVSIRVSRLTVIPASPVILRLIPSLWVILLILCVFIVLTLLFLLEVAQFNHYVITFGRF